MAQLRIQVHPGARRQSLRGRRADGALRLEVTAPPERGRANQAVTELLAGLLGVERRRLEVVRGLAARAKVVEVAGLDEAELERRVEAALARVEGGDDR
jgi:uncharacterized protein YggU (UPF0235/DUF167 family)